MTMFDYMTVIVLVAYGIAIVILYADSFKK